jgi:hypothetical protein
LNIIGDKIAIVHFIAVENDMPGADMFCYFYGFSDFRPWVGDRTVIVTTCSPNSRQATASSRLMSTPPEKATARD